MGALALSADQLLLLKEIENTASLLADKEEAAKIVRGHLQQLMVQGNALRVSTYRMARAAKISQPRVAQIIKKKVAIDANC